MEGIKGIVSSLDISLIYVIKQSQSMGKQKQILCNVCYRSMRSNNLKGHMKVYFKLQQNCAAKDNAVDSGAINNLLESELIRLNQKYCLNYTMFI